MEQEKTTQEELEHGAATAPGEAAVNSGEAVDGSAEQPSEQPLEPPEAESPEARMAALEEEKDALYDQLLRQRAEFENARKRTDRESEEKRQFAESVLVESLLPVLDAFERAEQALKEAGHEDVVKGYELIHKQLYDLLARAGLTPVEAVGKIFDPRVHHAVDRVETADHPDQEIVEEMQRGYRFKDRLLRPALVKVAVHAEPDAGSSAEAERSG